jgi:hypothetical protein
LILFPHDLNLSTPVMEKVVMPRTREVKTHQIHLVSELTMDMLKMLWKDLVSKRSRKRTARGHFVQRQT